MNQTLRYGLALLVIGLLIYLIGGPDVEGAAGFLALIGAVMLVVGLVRGPTSTSR